MKRKGQIYSKQILFETLGIFFISILGMGFFPSGKIFFALLPVVYVLIERNIRQRTWGSLGFNFQTFWDDLRVNWFLFFIVGIVIQPLIVMLSKNVFPAYLAHVQSRLPFESGIGWLTFLPLLAFSLLSEELTYRSLLQGRLTPFVGMPVSVAVTSSLFGLAHFAPGPGLVILVDIGLIIVDSVLFGIIFARRNNLWVVWLAHFLGDVMGLIFLSVV